MTDPNSDHIAGWVARIQAGDAAARNELLVGVAGRLADLTARMLTKYPTVRRYADADDVLQTASLRLLRALEQVRPATRRDFYALAAVQVRRELLDLARYYRTAGRTFAPPPAGDDSGRSWDHPPAPDPAADDLDRWGRFHEAVGELPADEREVVGLRFYHGWPEGRIADLLGVSERTVQRYWRAALGRLRAAVDGP